MADPDLLKSLRVAAVGLTQEKLAEEFGVSGATVHGWERKKFKPTELRVGYWLLYCARFDLDAATARPLPKTRKSAAA